MERGPATNPLFGEMGDRRFVGLTQAYDGEDFACVQLVWPDKQGRWPWDAAVREGFVAMQPVLGPSPS